MLDAVHVDSKDEKAVVAVRFKPAFKALFEIATTRNEWGSLDNNEAFGLFKPGGTGFVLVVETGREG